MTGEVQLRRIFQVVSGGTPDADPKNWDGPITWITPADLGRNDAMWIKDSPRTLTAEGLRSKSSLVPPGSIVLSIRAPIGHVAIADAPLVFNQGCKGLVPRQELDERFFYYQLLSKRRELRARGQGSTFVELSTEALAAVRLRVPPQAQQRRIADFLDRELGILASSESRLRRLRQLLGERVAASWSFRLHCGRLLNADVGLPADWGLIRLKFLARLQSGVTLGKSYLAPDLVKRPYLRVANVQDGRLDLADVSSIAVPEPDVSRYELRPGDVLMTEGGDNDKLGRGTVWNGEIPGCLHQNHVFAVRPDRTKLRSEYLAAVMASTHGKAYFQSTAHQTTNLASTNSAKLMNFPIPLPPPEAQDRLVHELHAGRASTVRLDAVLQEQLTLLAERRDALITAAVTGHLDPSSYRASAVAA